MFLYKRVLEIDLPWIDAIERAKGHQRLPVVMSPHEVQALLRHLSGTPKLIAAVLYGSGLRLLECLRLRSRTSSSNATRSPSATPRAASTASPSSPHAIERALRKHAAAFQSAIRTRPVPRRRIRRADYGVKHVTCANLKGPSRRTAEPLERLDRIEETDRSALRRFVTDLPGD